MIKDDLIALLDIIERECERGWEQSYYEQDRDKWGEYHKVIVKFKNELRKSSIL